jgi:RimJ/RimL family protein N-acetyltransferase
VIELRRADADDVDFLVELARHPEVEPFLSPHQARTDEEVAAEIERSRAEPERFGRILIWVGGRRAGAMRYELANERNRIANLGALAIHPDFRGRKLADEAARLLQRHLIFDLGFHRLQLEIYGFNERAQRHADRSGFVREGVKRKAYLKDGEWVDSVLYAIVREDLEPSSS